MKLMKKVIVIVDAFSTGRFLAPQFIAYGYQCVHVRSSLFISNAFASGYVSSNFIKEIIFETVTQTLKELSPYTVKLIIPGTESGVSIADILAHALGFKGHDPENRVLKRNKFTMAERLKQFGIPHIDQLKTDNLATATTWYKNKQYDTVVVKPLSSAGADGVTICTSNQELQTAFKSLLNTQNIFNETNLEICVQEYLKGTEYIVNTVSLDGQHFVTDVWRIFKMDIQGKPLCDYSEYVARDDPICKRLTEYIQAVLTAFQINTGPIHSELIVTQDRGPILVDLGIRLEGAIDLSVLIDNLGYNQLSVAVEAWLNPSMFQARLSNPNLSNNLTKPVLIRHIYLYSNVSGTIREYDNENFKKITNLPSFCSLYFSYQKNQTLETTVDLLTSPGYVYLVADSNEKLKADYKKIRNFEKSLYLEILKYMPSENN